MGEGGSWGVFLGKSLGDERNGGGREWRDEDY